MDTVMIVKSVGLTQLYKVSVKNRPSFTEYYLADNEKEKERIKKSVDHLKKYFEDRVKLEYLGLPARYEERHEN